jgi:hypothetical protein
MPVPARFTDARSAWNARNNRQEAAETRNEGGSVALMAWAWVNGCPWVVAICAVAAQDGNLEELKCARAHDCPWDERSAETLPRAGIWGR